MPGPQSMHVPGPPVHSFVPQQQLVRSQLLMSDAPWCMTRVSESVILSRLLYGLGSAWLDVADTRRLNGFHCRCLRVILRVQPAYFSRVSNKTVLEQSGQKPLDRQLLKHQMLLYGRVARSPATDPLRNLTFVPGGLEPATSRYIRRVGRPRNEWAVMVNRQCFKMDRRFADFIGDETAWKSAVHDFTSKPCI